LDLVALQHEGPALARGHLHRRCEDNGGTRMVVDDDRCSAEHPRPEIAGRVVDLDFRIERARAGIEGGGEPGDGALDAPAGERVDLDVRLLSEPDEMDVAL